MKPDAREAQAPESYATFWGPVPVDGPSTQPALNSPADTKDASREIANVTEGAASAPRAERP